MEENDVLDAIYKKMEQSGLLSITRDNLKEVINGSNPYLINIIYDIIKSDLHMSKYVRLAAGDWIQSDYVTRRKSE